MTAAILPTEPSSHESRKNSSQIEKKPLPPMLQEYVGYKHRYPDHFIFFQVGDFYELFFEDAARVASVLNITLTSRDKKDPDPIPMCGVPVAVIDGYLERLVDAGFSAAVISQVSNKSDGQEKTASGQSAPGGNKGKVERCLERVVTPGVRIMGSSGATQGHREGVLAIGFGNAHEVSFAWGTALDPQVSVREKVSIEELVELAMRLEVAEVVIPMEANGRRLDRRTSWIRELERLLPPNSVRFRSVSDHRLSQETERLGRVSDFTLLSLSAKRAVRTFVRYIDEMTVSAELPFLSIALEDRAERMTLDTMTRRNLELVQTARDGSYEGSLLHYLDVTRSQGGKRLLRKWIQQPLIHFAGIQARLEGVGYFKEHFDIRAQCAELLKRIPDLDRICARINLGVVTPRELAGLRDALESILQLRICLEENNSVHSVEILSSTVATIRFEEKLLKNLHDVLLENPSAQLAEGGIIRDGYDSEVDQLRRISEDTHQWLEAYEVEQRESTGISTLKVRSNNALGLYIEVTKANADKVPSTYAPRQTLTNAHRFTTEELRKWEKKLQSASSDLLARERELYQLLLLEVQSFCPEIRKVHQGTSVLDVLAALAQKAEEDNLTPPELVHDHPHLEVRGGWHPVLQEIIEDRCVPNNLSLHPERRCLLLTGPNMGGKSTYLRQAGLLVILAQIGSYVPAASVKMGVFDRVFARLGAADDLHEGDSTFMVEMKESAVITRHATSQSLVLIDELGRGTATADGLSLAQSLLEYLLSSVECYCLFATHFHELIDLEKSFERLKNVSVKVIEDGGEVVFTHEVVDGAVSRSYGIEVARLAGLPRVILQRASELLSSELSTRKEVSREAREQIPLAFGIEPIPSHKNDLVLSAVRDLLMSKASDEVTPKEALEILYKVQEIFHEQNGSSV
ncbi:MAG: DNA mismatch repair protein MutS [Bdellovibrionota bacterium]